MTDLQRTEALQPGDACEWRFPARQAWEKGTVVRNGGSGFWKIRCEAGHEHGGLYIEHVRAPGTNPWEELAQYFEPTAADDGRSHTNER